MKHEFVRVGIIGVGTIGSAHARAVYEGRVARMRLAALCDTDPAVRARLAEEYPDVKIFATHEELLAGATVDAVVIATPHYAHPPIAVAAFRAGLHVLTEKPAGVDTASVRRMIAAADESGTTFAIMFNQRTDKLFRTAKELVETGRIGELRRMVWIITNWYRKQAYYDGGSWRATWAGEGGGVLINQAPHNLDLWQWICGMPTSLSAECRVGAYHDIAVEDDAAITAHYATGATAYFITSTGEYPGTNRLEIVGSHGKLVLEGGTLTLHETARDERDFCREPLATQNPVTTTVWQEEACEGHVAVLVNFADAILDGAPLVADGREGLCSLTLSNAAYLSAWQGGREITLPHDEEAFLRLLAERAAKEEKKQVSDAVNTADGSYQSRWNTNW